RSLVCKLLDREDKPVCCGRAPRRRKRHNPLGRAADSVVCWLSRFSFGGATMQETNLIEQEQPVGVLTAQVPAPAPTMTLCSYGAKLTREELARVATPVGTATHKPIPHIAVVEKLSEALSFRQIGIVQE